MISSIGRYISGTLTETGRYNSATADETGAHGVSIVKELSVSGGGITGGVAEYSVVSVWSVNSGSIAGGESLYSVSSSWTVSGGAEAGGVALYIIPIIWSASGGAAAGGATNISVGLKISPTGGATAGGDCAINTGYATRVTGGAVSGGLGVIIKKKCIFGSRGAIAGGTATYRQYQSIPGVHINDVIALTINSTPSQTYTLCDRLITAGTIRKLMGGIIGALENANASATLDNADGELTALFMPPPLGVKVTIGKHSATALPYFTGIITSVSIGPEISLSLEAGERIPLSQNIPLISTTQMAGYREEKSIPMVYGTVTLSPVAADSGGAEWIAAGHPVEAIEAVFVDNAQISGWTWKNKTVAVKPDAVTMATITLNTPLQANEKLTCRVRGKRHPITGGLIQNPADIVWDILKNVCGIAIDYSELDRFRTEMITANIKLSGVIAAGDKTIRSTVDEIMSACGAIWSGQAPGIALQYLGAPEEPAAAVIPAEDITGITVQCAMRDIATALKLTFAQDYGQVQPGKTAIFESKNAIKQYGRTQTELDLPWLTASRNAVELGVNYLQWKSTPQWSIEIETGGDHQEITPGQWITVNHPHIPGGTVTAICTGVELDIVSGKISLTLSKPADSINSATLSSLSVAFDPQTLPGPSVQFANGRATITFTDDKGAPLSGAKVTMDGSQTKITDKAGKATFTCTRGTHHIKVEATGYQPMEGEIEV